MDLRTTEAVRQIFQDSQRSATHRKNAAALWKLQQRLCKDVSGEKAFNEEFLRNLNLALPIKKGAGVADRVIRFVAQYVKFAVEKDTANAPPPENSDDESDTLSSRFVHRLLTHLMKGLKAKDKNVRMRVCQLIAESISAIQDIDLDLYNKLKMQLFQRLREKDPAVRVQAVKAISELQTSEGLEDEEGRSVEDVLMEMMQYDPSGDVRRVVMENLGPTDLSRPAILERARDIDTIIRKTLYSKVLFGDEIRMDHLSLDERERILMQGLTDREVNVQKACGRLLSERWIKQSDNNLVSFLAQFDVVSNPTVAEHAIKAFLAGNPRFTPPNDDSIWQDLLPEVALILAVYCEQAAASGNQEAIDTLIPEVSAQVNRIEKYFKLSIAGTDPESSMSEEEAEMTKIGYDFVLTQLLRIAMVLDYGDEVGRRNMFASLRRMLSSSMLDEIHLTSIVDVMRKTAFDERDFARIVVEIITDMISESDPPSASQEATEADDISGAERYIMKMNAISRCLEIIRCVLEKLDGDLNSLPSLVGLLNELVLPATKIGDETLLSIQHRSLYCLALFCLLDRSLAVDHYSTFRDTFAAAASMDIRTLCLRSMFDLVCLYGATTMGRGNSPDALKPLLDALEYPSEVINSIAVQGVSKLALLGQVDDEKTLRLLGTLYFHPVTLDNPRLRQCLSVFFGIYPHSSKNAKLSLLKVVPPLWFDLVGHYKKLDKQGQSTMTAPLLIGQQLLDWIDVRKLQTPDPEAPNLHVQLALDMVIHLLSTKSASTRKLTCQMLARVDLDTPAPVKAIKKLLFALERLKQFTNDIIALNALKKLSSSLLKRDEEVAPLTEDDLKEIADFRDQIRGAYGWEVDDDEEQHSTSSRRKTAERKVVAESDRDEEVPGPHSRGLRTRKSKALVQAEESDADSDSSEASTSSGSTSSSDASDSDDD